MQIIENIALISINETLIIQLISFLIFLFIINRVMIRPLRRAMSERETYAEQLQKQMKDARGEVERVTRQITDQENEAIRQARALSDELEHKGKAEAEEIVAATRKDVARQMKSAESEVKELITRARQSVQAESEVLAAEIMQKMLDRRLV
jgi:F-type H+-transporting ATPase subunit b